MTQELQPPPGYAALLKDIKERGRPLTCKTRKDALPLDKPITVHPMKAFPVIKDLVTDVSWNYRVNKKIPPFEPRPGTD